MPCGQAWGQIGDTIGGAWGELWGRPVDSPSSVRSVCVLTCADDFHSLLTEKNRRLCWTCRQQGVERRVCGANRRCGAPGSGRWTGYGLLSVFVAAKELGGEFSLRISSDQSCELRPVVGLR